MNTLIPLYTDGENKSPLLRDLVEDRVTVNPSFVEDKLIFGNGDKQRRYAVTEQETMFNEIKVVPYEEAFEHHSECLSFENGSGEAINGEAYLEAFERVINSYWDSTKFNLIYHSSGWDSRLIGHFIKKIYKQDPSPVLFVCWGIECDAFEDIMKYHNFDESQYIKCPFFIEEPHPFDFTDAWKQVNGGSTHVPASMYHTAINYLRREGKIPEDPSVLRIWTGLDNNSMFSSRKAGWYGDIDDNYRRVYYSWALRMWGFIEADTFQPGMDIEIGRVIFSSASRRDIMRRKLLELADPKLAGQLYVKPSRPQVSVTESMVSDFQESYYYKNIEQVPIPNFRKSTLMHEGRSRAIKRFWRKWTGASLIDELVRRGVHVNA